LRVDLKRLDYLVNLVGELVIDRSRFARIEEELRGSDPGSELSNQMSESILLFSRHMNEVQSVIMKIRMVPVGNAFYKFTRVVRDLSRQINKEIDLVIEGGETELDKTIVEEIGDPLVHLIRNSVDHGIELPEDREKAGKPRKGTVTLTAAQDGNMIVITVKDDGKGLQVERLRNKGIANGLIKETDNLTDRDIFNLIFEAGFSTAEKITNISGRGVGMDVVKKNIVKLKGIIELDSEIGKGTTTTIKLPLTLAIIPSLMVGVMGESYAIPLANVIETIRMDPKDVQKVGNSAFVKLRDQVIPLMRLTDAFGLAEMEDRFWCRPTERDAQPLKQKAANGARTQQHRLIFVVVGVSEKRVGIVVDTLMGQQEIVIKSLGRLMGHQRGVAGGCVLGNGRVALVLDAGELIEDFSLANRRNLDAARSGGLNRGA
jgi:chemotaxis protein histidine kinase CheA